MSGTASAGERDPRIRAQFAARAPVYDGVSAWVRDPGMLQAIAAECRVAREASLLDVCCGTGAVGGAFGGRVARRTGADLTWEMLGHARSRLDVCVQGSALALPFAGKSFDLAVNRQALHFIAHPERAMAEIFRVLKPGGQFIMCHRIPYSEVDAAWWERVNAAKQEMACNFFVEPEIRRLLAAAGFERTAVKDYHLWESIVRWVDSPEARAATERIFELYRTASPAIVALRGISVTDDEIRDRWRWAIFSAFRPR